MLSFLILLNFEEFEFLFPTPFSENSCFSMKIFIQHFLYEKEKLGILKLELYKNGKGIFSSLSAGLKFKNKNSASVGHFIV